MLGRCAKVLVLSASVLAASIAHANVFNMPIGQTSLEFVTVGDAGNAADTTGYGSVAYTYQMGEYDVTVGQYCQFLNAVAAADTYRLYCSGMAADLPTIKIIQSGSSGSYSYSVAGSYSQAANCPIFDVSWGDAARFCNWLQNGQPTTLGEAAGSTETGAYTLSGDTTNLLEARNSGASYFLPSENEWYKAAYFKGGSASAGYWTYPTRNNTAPSRVLSTSGTNNANFSNGGLTDPTNDLTPVGYFAGSPGPYGTFDMGGNVWQWDEAKIGGSRGIRGGDWDDSSIDLASSTRSAASPTSNMYDNLGFRVASLSLLAGDANGDGKVDINDLTIVLTNYGQTGLIWSQGDFNTDAKVDINDLTIVLTKYGATSGAGVKIVPEPSCAALLGVGAIALLAFAQRRRAS